jgi:hypothetical protein
MSGVRTTSTAEKSQATQSFFVFVRDNNTGQINSVVIPGDLQVGLLGNPADTTLMGRFSINVTNYDVTFANKGIIQSTPDDTVIGVNLVTTPLSGRISLHLSATPREGELHFIKDLTGTADVVPIDIYPTTGYQIDGMALVTLSDSNGSAAIVFMNGNWHQLAAGVGSGANPDSSYITAIRESSLPDSRVLSGSHGVLVVDQGAGQDVLLSVDPTFFVGEGNISVLTSSTGDIVISGSTATSFSVTGSGDTSVSLVGTQYIVSSSVPGVQSVVAGNLNIIVGQIGTQWAVSASFVGPPVQQNLTLCLRAAGLVSTGASGIVQWNNDAPGRNGFSWTPFTAGEATLNMSGFNGGRTAQFGYTADIGYRPSQVLGGGPQTFEEYLSINQWTMGAVFIYTGSLNWTQAGAFDLLSVPNIVGNGTSNEDGIALACGRDTVVTTNTRIGAWWVDGTGAPAPGGLHYCSGSVAGTGLTSTPHSLLVVYNAGMMTAYIDGTSIVVNSGGHPDPGYTLFAQRTLMVGVNQTSANSQFCGAIAEVDAWNRALTASEIVLVNAYYATLK